MTTKQLIERLRELEQGATPKKWHVNPAYCSFMIIADGEAELVIGGKRYPVKKGDVAVFASNREHGTYASDKGLKTIEIFIPVRQEYMDKLDSLKKSLGK